MVRFVTGDMFAGKHDILVNTVNCVGVMGTGVALAFRERYPEMYKEYRKACEVSAIRIGRIAVWRTISEWVVNFPTKRHWRDKSEYEYIESGLQSLRNYLSEQGNVSVAVPALGCGHGGLDWNRVRPMIEQALGNLQADIEVFEPANSVEIGRRVHRTAVSRLGLDAHELVRGDPAFPPTLRTSDVPRITVLGSDALLQSTGVAVLLSRSPSEREITSTLAIVRTMAREGVTFALAFGSRLAHQLASVAAEEQSSGVVLWATEGAGRLRIPSAIRALIKQQRVALATAAAPSDPWTPKLSHLATLLQIMSSRALLLASPTPESPFDAPYLAAGLRLPPVFFLRYDGDSTFSLHLRSMGATPVGRRRVTGGPNVAQLIEAVRASRALG